MGLTWPGFALWASCSWFPLCPGAKICLPEAWQARCILTVGGSQQQWVAKPQQATDYLWRNKDLGRCRCETEAACTCKCDALGHTCTFVTMCTRGVRGCVCTCAPGGCIKTWKCVVERVLHSALERVKSAMGDPESGSGGHSQGGRGERWLLWTPSLPPL